MEISTLTIIFSARKYSRYKKKRWDIWRIFFSDFRSVFSYKGVFFAKVIKAIIIAFIKTKILRPVLSVTNPPFQKCQPLLHSALVLFCPILLSKNEMQKVQWLDVPQIRATAKTEVGRCRTHKQWCMKQIAMLYFSVLWILQYGW